MLLFIWNVCLRYAPKWMISSLIFQKFSGEGLTEPPPQTPPPVFSWASPSVRGFALNSQALRAFDSGASRPRFGLRPQLLVGELGLAPPKINCWIRHWLQPCLIWNFPCQSCDPAEFMYIATMSRLSKSTLGYPSHCMLAKFHLGYPSSL